MRDFGESFAEKDELDALSDYEPGDLYHPSDYEPAPVLVEDPPTGGRYVLTVTFDLDEDLDDTYYAQLAASLAVTAIGKNVKVVSSTLTDTTS